MSIFKLIALPLIALIFGLTSATTTYASNSMVVNEAVSSASAMYRTIVHIQGGTTVSNNTPVTILSKATYGTGNLVSLSLYVNGVMLTSSTSNFAMATYTPTSPGIYSVTSVAVYSNITVADAEMLRVQ